MVSARSLSYWGTAVRRSFHLRPQSFANAHLAAALRNHQPWCPRGNGFFVLSGFLVGGSVIRAGERFRLSDYVTARLCRLWVVLIPALLLTLAMETVTVVIAPDALKDVFAQQWHSGPDPSAAYGASLVTFLGNIAFVQKLWVPVFGTNRPLWACHADFDTTSSFRSSRWG